MERQSWLREGTRAKLLTQRIIQLLHQPSPAQSSPISGNVYNRLYHELDSILLHCTDTAKDIFGLTHTTLELRPQHRKLYLPTALKVPYYTYHSTHMQLSNAFFRLLVKATQKKISIEKLLSRAKPSTTMLQSPTVLLSHLPLHQ